MHSRNLFFSIIFFGIIFSGCQPVNRCLSYSEVRLNQIEDVDNALISIEDSFDIKNDRESQFSGKLNLEVNSVVVNVYEGTEVNQYELEIHGIISNSSDEQLVIRRLDDIGFSALTAAYIDIKDHEGNFFSFYSPLMAPHTIPSLPFSADEFIVVNSNECVKLEWEVQIPDVIKDGAYIPLPPGNYQLKIEYWNVFPGYVDLPEDFVDFDSLVLHLDNKNLIDLNAWVGKIDSNYIDFVIPSEN